MRRRSIALAAVIVALAAGCSALLDLPSDPRFVACVGACDEAGADGAGSEAGEDDGAITFGGGDGSDIGDACGLTTPDDDAGIFVVKGGRDAGPVVVCDAAVQDADPDADAADLDATVCTTLPGPARGTRQNPCASIQEALDLAQSSSKPFVYVAGGSYAEAITLRAGVSVVGAWVATGDTWTRACDQGAGQVIVQAPDDASAIVTADTLGGSASLAALTLKSKTTNIQPGESLYGVFARGTTTNLTLSYVFVEVAPAGGGALGKPGPNGVTPNGCTTAGNGAPAAAAGANGTPATAGSFGNDGWSGGKGGDGKPGLAGQNGSLGGNGACVTCVTCQKQAGNCTAVGSSQECGERGLSGCGGAAGGGGGGGGGGGASVGLFVWGANVTVLGGGLQAAAGGVGGAGGTAGNPGAPGNGAVGSASSPCGTTCPATAGPCIAENLQSGQGGSPGTAGGAGTAGGSGGGGAGGASCASFHGASGAAALNNTRLGVGNPGRGAPGAPDGPATFECQ